MKVVCNILVFMVITFSTRSQTGDHNMQKQLDELKNRIKLLEKENINLKTETRTFDSALYSGIRSEIFDAVSNLPQLDFDFKNTNDKISLTGLFAKLMQANNPTSDILGFRFSEIIFTAAEKHFKATLKNEQDRKRFSQVIGKIISNPVVSSLANTNPLTSVVAAIISTIASFSTSGVELEKEGGRIKEISLTQQDAFDNPSISAFRSELQVYIDFYDALIVASAEYIEGINTLSVKYAFLKQSVCNYKTEFYNEMKVKDNNLLIRLSKLLPDPAMEGVNYRQLINDPGILRVHNHALKYPIIYQDVSSFKTEYNTLLFKYLSENIKILKLTENFPEYDIDKSKTNALIHEIESFLNDKIKNEPYDLQGF